MKLLHVLKSEADQNTKTLMDALSEGKETATFPLYEGDPDYERIGELATRICMKIDASYTDRFLAGEKEARELAAM